MGDKDDDKLLAYLLHAIMIHMDCRRITLDIIFNCQRRRPCSRKLIGSKIIKAQLGMIRVSEPEKISGNDVPN